MIAVRQWTHRLGLAFLTLVIGAALFPRLICSSTYEEQFRDEASARPSRRFPLGTDELGRDRLSRLLYGSRVSLLLAPSAAALATSIAVVLGLSAGYFGGGIARATLASTDLTASVPTILLLFTARALMPLNVSPIASVCFTFLLLGALGWTSGVRVIQAAAVRILDADFIRQAKAYGCRPSALMFRHMARAVRPVVIAQFWVLIPVFLLAEANLGMLGLGVTEPVPSWGNLLAELQSSPPILEAPWLLAPAVLLLLVLLSFQAAISRDPTS